MGLDATWEPDRRLTERSKAFSGLIQRHTYLFKGPRPRRRDSIDCKKDVIHLCSTALQSYQSSA